MTDRRAAFELPAYFYFYVNKKIIVDNSLLHMLLFQCKH